MTHNPQATIYFEEKDIKKKRNTKKWGHPSSWLVIGDGKSTTVYNYKYLTSSWTEIEPQTAITNKPEESKEKR